MYVTFGKNNSRQLKLQPRYMCVKCVMSVYWNSMIIYKNEDIFSEEGVLCKIRNLLVWQGSNYIYIHLVVFIYLSCIVYGPLTLMPLCTEVHWVSVLLSSQPHSSFSFVISFMTPFLCLHFSKLNLSYHMIPVLLSYLFILLCLSLILVSYWLCT